MKFHFNVQHQLDMVERIAGIGSWRVDLVKGKLIWSDHVYTIHGVTRDTYTPELKSAIGFYHPEDLPLVQQVVNNAINNKEDYQFELRIIRADGAIRWVHSKGECELNEAEEVIAVNGIFLDITDRKNTEIKLQKSEERFSLAIKGLKSGVWDWIDVHGDAEWWSPQFYHLLGYENEEIPATLANFAAALHPDDTERTFKLVEEHFAGKADFDLEYRLKTKPGSYRWFHGHGVASRDERGTPTRMVGSITDIHERKKSEEQLDTYFNLSVNLLSIASPTHFLRINPAFTKTLGYSKEELLSRPFADFVHPDDKVTTNREVERLESGKITMNFENRYRHKEGHYIWLSWAAFFDTDENLIYSTARDITKQHHQEELLRQYNHALKARNQDLDDFAYSASHDLKAPLRAIDNLSAWIVEDAKDVLPEKSYTHLVQLRQRVNRMEALLDDLLQYSRAGRAEYETEEVDVKQLIQDILKTLDAPPGFTINIPTHLPVLRTHRIPLSQVFSNLIANALKHHDKEQGIVDISHKQDNELYYFSIRDDGPGIDPAFHGRIFQMFQTLKPRDEIEGSGMGLAIVQKLARNFGGDITVSSTPGKGATFEFSWPITIAHKPQALSTRLVAPPMQD